VKLLQTTKHIVGYKIHNHTALKSAKNHAVWFKSKVWAVKLTGPSFFVLTCTQSTVMHNVALQQLSRIDSWSC